MALKDIKRTNHKVNYTWRTLNTKLTQHVPNEALMGAYNVLYEFKCCLWTLDGEVMDGLLQVCTTFYETETRCVYCNNQGGGFV